LIATECAICNYGNKRKKVKGYGWLNKASSAKWLQEPIFYICNCARKGSVIVALWLLPFQKYCLFLFGTVASQAKNSSLTGFSLWKFLDALLIFSRIAK